MARTEAEWRNILEGRLDELDARLHEIDAELDSHANPDWEEMAIEREGDDVLERMGQSGETEIRMIRAALDRLDKGVFGVCVRCGDDIDEARLELIPFTPFCATCASGKGP